MPAVFSIDGKKVKDMKLPKVFETPYMPDLIKRAVLAVESTRIQAFGNKPGAGRNNTAEYIGVRGKPTAYRTINVGRARLPRLRNRRGILYGKVAAVPQAVGGPRAHAPKVLAKTEEHINTKERKKAIASAIAATIDKEIVRKRGHVFNDAIFPLIVDAPFEKMTKTKDVMNALSSLGIREDVDAAKAKTRTRAGKNKNRGKPTKTKKTLLIITNGTQPIYKAARNLKGVEVVQIQSLNAAHLAPGTHAGRLTVWTEEAINVLSGGDQ